jgi:hypothetical protein
LYSAIYPVCRMENVYIASSCSFQPIYNEKNSRLYFPFFFSHSVSFYSIVKWSPWIKSFHSATGWAAWKFFAGQREVKLRNLIYFYPALTGLWFDSDFRVTIKSRGPLETAVDYFAIVACSLKILNKSGELYQITIYTTGREFSAPWVVMQ